jgi:hypothetical protein
MSPAPISNYQVPGVYVTQSGTSLTAINPTNLNIAIVSDNPVAGTNTDSFTAVGVSGNTVGQLTIPMVNLTSSGTYSAASGNGFTLTYTVSGVTVTGTLGNQFNISTNWSTGFSSLTTTAITGTPISGAVSITYGHNWGAYGTYGTFNQAASALGTMVSGTTIVSPALLATQFAFLNGANTVTILPVARLASSGTAAATVSDWSNVFAITNSGTNQIYMSAQPAIDVIVPTYGFVNASGVNAGQVVTYASGSGTVAGALTGYLQTQANGGIYQRAFIGVDATGGQVTPAGLQALASGIGSTNAGTRVSLVFPGSINYNPNSYSNTQISNTSFNIPGYYLAAAVAGIFVGQTNVATPITNKIVSGFNFVPNQIGQVDAATNYLPYGITTVFQKRDGNLWVLQGLTTNTTNWLSQEISLNAIGDQLANTISSALQSTNLIGGPLTANTASAALGEVQGQLTNAVSNGLIQSYQNLNYAVNAATPTTINITFQYSPTYPINYIQVTMSLNTQTGQVIASNSTSNLVVY